MSYVALYREWRPKTFRDIIGQEHITRTLKNQIEQGRIAHAYLFCGTRGTGKTSTAKVFAKAVNCLHPEDSEPCGKCEICTAIENGSVMDIYEIDAASNTGVDNIRELREDVKYTPSKCKYKVYIIDEVHMLSMGAFNALLKTLEEPPAHVIFILATTEFHKVPATIVSRCQRFDFKRVKIVDMVSRLRDIANQSGINVEDRTLNLIARNSDGALRDALSIFDQCISLSGGDVAYDDVLSILGVTTEEYLIKIVDAVQARDAARCISLIDELILEGKDVHQFIKDLILHYRNLMICKVSSDALDILNVPEEMYEEFAAQSKKLSTESILRNINILSGAESDAKWSLQPRIIFEMALLRMCRKELGTDADSLLERIANLEKALSPGAAGVPKAIEAEKPEKKPATGSKNKENQQTIKPPSEEKKEGKQLSSISLKDIKGKWKEILKTMSAEGHKTLYAFMTEGKPVDLLDDTLTVGFEKGYMFHKQRLEEPENRKLAEHYISLVCGCKLKLKCISLDEVAADRQEEDIVEKAKSIFGEDLVVVEE